MSHASKEISPGNIPVIHHKLFDPLDMHLRVQGIKLWESTTMRKVEFVNITKEVLYSYYKKLYRLKEIIEINRKQSDDNLTQAVFDEEDFISRYDDSRGKKNTAKYIKSRHNCNSNKLDEYKGEHDLLAFSKSFEDWRLSYLNYVTNEPAEAEDLYFLSAANARTPSELSANKQFKKPTNNDSKINSLTKLTKASSIALFILSINAIR